MNHGYTGIAEICGKKLDPVLSEYPTILLTFTTVAYKGQDSRLL